LNFREGSKAVIVWRGRNKAGRFLEVAVYAEGGWKGMVLFPEGRAGQGWSRVSGELSKALAFFGSKIGSSSLVRGVDAGATPLFAAVVRSVVPSSVLKRPVVIGLLGFAGSTAELDLFPLGTPEISPVLRSAVDFYELEMASFDALFVPGEEDSPSIRDCRLLGSACSSGRAEDVAGWLALVDQSICDLGRALGRVKNGWKALGLGLKPISGPFCFKLPKALKAGLDLSSSCSTRRRKQHRLTMTQASAAVDLVGSLDGFALFSTQVLRSELPKIFEVGLGSSSISEADPG
jgi:hypothetical protein